MIVCRAYVCMGDGKGVWGLYRFLNLDGSALNKQVLAKEPEEGLPLLTALQTSH